MPEPVRDRLRSEAYPPEFVRYLFLHWRDGAWDMGPGGPRWPHDGWDLELAAGLHAALHGTDPVPRPLPSPPGFALPSPQPAGEPAPDAARPVARGIRAILDLVPGLRHIFQNRVD